MVLKAFPGFRRGSSKARRSEIERKQRRIHICTALFIIAVSWISCNTVYHYSHHRAKSPPRIVRKSASVSHATSKPVSADRKLSRRIPGSRSRGVAAEEYDQMMNCYAREGKWVFNPKPRAYPWNIIPIKYSLQPNYSSCDILFAKENPGALYGSQADRVVGHPDSWKVRQSLMYRWRTPVDRCPFLPFKRRKFCSVLSGRNIVIVGDQFSGDFHDVLLNNLISAGKPIADISDAWDPEGPGCSKGDGHLVCDRYKDLEPSRLRLVLDPALSPTSGGWLQNLKKWNTGVLILSRGSTFIPTEQLKLEVRQTLKAVRETYPDLLLMWQSSFGGHPNCNVHWAPLREVMDPALVRSAEHWEKIPGQNAALRPVLKEFGVAYLDIEGATSLRPDGHYQTNDSWTDCHHYCLPGPPDHWAEMLLNALLLLDYPGNKTAGSQTGSQAGSQVISQVKRPVDGQAGNSREDHKAQAGRVLWSAEEREAQVRRAVGCFSEGRWERDPTPRKLPWGARSATGWQSCDELHQRQGGIFGASADRLAAIGQQTGWTVREPLLYRWHTNAAKCRFDDFDRARFCSLVGRRNLVLLGDASQAQFYESIRNHLEASQSNTSEPAGHDLADADLCEDVVGGSGFNIQLLKDDFSTDDWLAKMKRWNVDVVIVSAPLPQQRSGNEEGDRLKSLAEHILSSLRFTFPKIVLLWRSAVMSHQDCQLAKAPLEPQSPQQFDLHADSRAIVQKYGGLYLDVSTATSLRPDGHLLLPNGSYDCKSYCLPGPVDHWVTLLQNVLTMYWMIGKEGAMAS